MQALRYYSTVLLLKGFNTNAATRRIYRYLGNRKNRSAESRILPKYFEMTPGLYATVARAGALADGHGVLEIGTGWAHWDAVIARNLHEVTATLYDVWDNRSFERFTSYLRQLTEPEVRSRLGLDERALDLTRRAAAARSFEEAYAILGFDYVVDPGGRLEALEGRSYDFMVSRDVGEHIHARDLDAILGRSFALLRRGGWALHQVVLTDHLKIYVPGLHPKAYLRFDRAFHRDWIANNIQYTNLLQIPDWRAAFQRAGFAVEAIDRVGTHPLSGIRVHPSWRDVPEQDLACTVVQFLVRKPEAS